MDIGQHNAIKSISLTARFSRHFLDDSFCHHQQRHQENNRKVPHLYKHKHTQRRRNNGLINRNLYKQNICRIATALHGADYKVTGVISKTRCHAIAGTTARCGLHNECTNPNSATGPLTLSLSITYNNRHVSHLRTAGNDRVTFHCSP